MKGTKVNLMTTDMLVSLREKVHWLAKEDLYDKES